MQTFDDAARLAAIVASSEDAIISIDLNGILTSWNPAAERIYGYSPTETIGQPNRLIIPPDRYSEEEEVCRRVLAGEPVQHYESVRVRKDGVYIDVFLTVSALRDSDQEVIGISEISRDITAQKHAEVERARAEQRFRQAIDSMSDAFAAIDRDWRFTYVNDRYAQMFARRREDLIGQVVWEAFPEATKLELYNGARHVMEGGGPVTVEEYYAPLDIWFSTRIHATPDGIVTFTSDITERKRIDRVREEAFATARELAAIVESTDDAIIRMDLGGTIQTWNRAAEHVYGFTAAEAIGQSVRILHPPDRQTEELALLDRVHQGERIVGFETMRCRKGGDCFPAALTISPIRDDSGVVVGASKIARDISRRQRAEGRFRLAVEAAPTAMLIVDRDGAIAFVNGLAERLFGYTRKELLTKAVDELIPERFRAVHPGHRAHFYTELTRRPMGAGRDLFALRKDGSEVPVEIGLSPFESDGSVFVLAAITDISERKRVNQRAAFLAEAGTILAGSLDYEITLKAVTNLAVPAIADWCAVDILSEEHRLERLAVAHVDPAKIDLARTIRSRYEDPSSPFSPASVVRTGEPAVVKDISDDMIVASAHGDQERIAMIRSLGLRSYMVVPLTANGRTFGALTFATAESGRKYTDDDFRFAQDVAFHAALAVDNARAYQSAQTANRLKDEFLATLSHELRTPLNAIVGYSRLLRSGMVAQDRQAHALGTVERNAAALTQIVEDILDVSRIISGKIRLNIQPVEVAQVIKNAIETVQPAADAKHIRIQTILDPRAGPISGDPDRLQQIVWNVVSNAVKFTPKQGLVQVRLERIDSHAEIVVSDTGIGIAPDFLPHIFERFRQADSGTTRAHAGIGLGLAIVRHLVELHGGTIHAASGGKNRGATFRVRLPLMIVHAEPASDRRAHLTENANIEAGALPRLEGVKILAVDDDADGRALVTETLEAAGAMVTTVDSAAKAIDALAAVEPDVLLADIGMAGSDGFDLIRQVRQSPEQQIREVPAAALTAYARSEDRLKALQAGFQMHLAKPVDPAELIVAVAALAQQRLKPPPGENHSRSRPRLISDLW